MYKLQVGKHIYFIELLSKSEELGYYVARMISSNVPEWIETVVHEMLLTEAVKVS